MSLSPNASLSTTIPSIVVVRGFKAVSIPAVSALITFYATGCMANPKLEQMTASISIIIHWFAV